MMESGRNARQPIRVPWSRERLVHERAIALGNAIDKSTLKTYGSALNSYLSFVKMHDLPVDPTEETLSFFAVYMAHHINPKSVNNYLTGIVQQLESMFPHARDARNSQLVRRTLQGCMRLKGVATKRKRALTLDDLQLVLNHYHASTKHNDLLFVSMILTGFFALMRLGELTFPDDVSLRNWRKVSQRSSVKITDEHYEFHLPAHKADRYFEGNRIIVRAKQFRHNPLTHFRTYMASRDRIHPLSLPLWLMENGDVPTRSFFMTRVCELFKDDVAGQSMRAGGATSLAEHGVPPSIIQPLGRWSSQAFLIYVRKNPALIQGMLHAQANTAAASGTSS